MKQQRTRTESFCTSPTTDLIPPDAGSKHFSITTSTTRRINRNSTTLKTSKVTILPNKTTGDCISQTIEHKKCPFSTAPPTNHLTPSVFVPPSPGRGPPRTNRSTIVTCHGKQSTVFCPPQKMCVGGKCRYNKKLSTVLVLFKYFFRD
jgi:hypothetical protein